MRCLWFINNNKKIWKIQVIITKQPIQPEIYTASMSLVCFGFLFFFFFFPFVRIHSQSIVFSGLFSNVCCNNADCRNVCVCVCLNFHQKLQWRKKRTNKSGFVCIVSSALWLWCNSLGENETRFEKDLMDAFGSTKQKIRMVNVVFVSLRFFPLFFFLKEKIKSWNECYERNWNWTLK